MATTTDFFDYDSKFGFEALDMACEGDFFSFEGGELDMSGGVSPLVPSLTEPRESHSQDNSYIKSETKSEHEEDEDEDEDKTASSDEHNNASETESNSNITVASALGLDDESFDMHEETQLRKKRAPRSAGPRNKEEIMERNRIAAQQARAKKKNYIQNLEAEVAVLREKSKQLSHHNAVLVSENKMLKESNAFLQGLVGSHNLSPGTAASLPAMPSSGAAAPGPFAVNASGTSNSKKRPRVDGGIGVLFAVMLVSVAVGFSGLSAESTNTAVREAFRRSRELMSISSPVSEHRQAVLFAFGSIAMASSIAKQKTIFSLAIFTAIIAAIFL